MPSLPIQIGKGTPAIYANLNDFGIIDSCYFADLVGRAIRLMNDRDVVTDSYFKRCHGGAVEISLGESTIKRSTFERCVDQNFAHLRIIHTIAFATISYQVYSRQLRRSYLDC